MKKFINFLFFLSFTITLFLIVVNVKYVDATEVYPFRGTIVGDALGVHSTDDYYGSSEVTQLLYGSKVTVLGLGKDGSRYLIKYDGDKTGYVSKNYVENIDASTLTTDAANLETYRAYCDSLISQGFVESYCPYLYYLHSKHPSWIFKPVVINVNFSDIVKGEEGKNYIQLSTYRDVYTSSNVVREGSNYYTSNNTVNAY